MKLPALIPPQFRITIALALAAALLIAGSTAGWVVASWRSDSKWAEQVRTADGNLAECQTRYALLTSDIGDLTAAVGRQNDAVDVLAAESARIAEAQDKARGEAQKQATAAERRIDSLQRQIASGATCGQAVQSYWGMSP